MSENWTDKLKCTMCARINCSIEICPCKCHKMKLGDIKNWCAKTMIKVVGKELRHHKIKYVGVNGNYVATVQR